MGKNIDILLLDRFMRGETSAEEERMLLAWFRSDVARDELFDLYRRRWQESKSGELDEEVLERMLQQTKARMRMSEPPHHRKRINLWTKYVAAVIFIIGIGIASYVFTRQSTVEDVKEEYVVEADKGQRASITLPDGTKVWLNSHTQLSYLADYGRQERIVTLKGEAYFEVAKDKERRFVVKTDMMDVEALGTSFNVKAYKADDKITTTLFTGSVRVSAYDKSVVLSPNQQVQLSRTDRKLKVNVPDNSRYANMWRDNELAFNKETFEDIAIVLNRLYNVQIVFDSEKIKHYRFSGVIKNNSLDNVIEIISLTAPITYRSRGDTIILGLK
ncbi:FecR family protein [Parabacteroides sp.]